jgi:hypothetical protein
MNFIDLKTRRQNQLLFHPPWLFPNSLTVFVQIFYFYIKKQDLKFRNQRRKMWTIWQSYWCNCIIFLHGKRVFQEAVNHTLSWHPSQLWELYSLLIFYLPKLPVYYKKKKQLFIYMHNLILNCYKEKFLLHPSAWKGFLKNMFIIQHQQVVLMCCLSNICITYLSRWTVVAC